MIQKESVTAKQAPWMTDGAVPKQYPWLTEPQSCDVCVVGGGLTAALCALRLAEAGRSVVLAADGTIGFGEDACLSAGLAADMGLTLTSLSRRFDTESSLRLLAMGNEALDELDNLCRSLDAEEDRDGFSSGFRRCDTLLFTDDESDLPLLESEYRARKHNGLSCTYLTRETARDAFSFALEGGILSKEAGASLQPYFLTHLCLARAERMGAKIYEHTPIADMELPRGGGENVLLTTAAHRSIYADTLVLATGSRGMASFLPDFRQRTRYASVTRPIAAEELRGWPGQCHLRAFGRPEWRCSLTPDNRIAIDGRERRGLLSPRALLPLREMLQLPDPAERRWDALSETVEALFPAVPDIRAAYEYATSYACADDGLPVIGTHPSCEKVLFALCTGPSSVLHGMLAAQHVASLIEGRHSADLTFFRPER